MEFCLYREQIARSTRAIDLAPPLAASNAVSVGISSPDPTWFLIHQNPPFEPLMDKKETGDLFSVRPCPDRGGGFELIKVVAFEIISPNLPKSLTGALLRRSKVTHRRIVARLLYT